MTSLISRHSSLASALSSFVFLLFIEQIHHPGEADENHQRTERLSAAHAEEVDTSKVGVRLAEKFDEKAEQAVPHQIEAGHLVVEFRNLTQVVQNDE